MNMGESLKAVLFLLVALQIQSTAISLRTFNILAVFDKKGGQLWQAVKNEVRLQNLEFEKATEYNRSTSCIFRLSVFPMWINNSLSPLDSLQTLSGAIKENKYCSILYTAFSASRIGNVIVEYAFANNITIISTTTEHHGTTSKGSLSFSFGEAAESKASMVASILKELSLRKFALLYDSTFDSFHITMSLHHVTNYEKLILMKEIRISSKMPSLQNLHQLLASLKTKGCKSVVVLSDSIPIIKRLFNLTLNGLLEMKKILVTNLILDQLDGVKFSSEVVVIHPPKAQWTLRDVIVDSVTLVSTALRQKSSLCRQSLNILRDVPSYISECPSHFYRRLSETKFQGKSGLVEFNNDGRRRQAFTEIHKSLRTNKGMIWKHIGYWNGKRSVITDESFLPEVRVVLTECTPSVTAFPKLPQEQCQSPALICYKNVVAPSGKIETLIKCCRGYAIDVLRLLENEAGFRSDLRLSDDGKFGVYNVINNSWNGIVSELIQDKADMSVDLFVSSRRSKAVKFTEAYMPAGITLLVRQRKLGSVTISWLSYLRPFSTNVWITFLGALCIMVLNLWAVEKLSFRFFSPTNDERNKQPSDGDDWVENDRIDEDLDNCNNLSTKISKFPRIKSIFNLENALFYTIAVACQRPVDDSRPNTNSTRLAALSFSMAMLVFVSAYSANLVRSLIVDETFLPVTDIRDKKFQHPPPGFRYGTVSGTYTEDFFRNSNNMFFQALWYHMKQNNVDTLEHGLQKLRSGTLDVLISDNIALVYASLHDQNCELKVVGDTFGTSGVSVAVRKDSIWFAPIADVLEKLKDNGLMDYIQGQYIKNDQCQKKVNPPQQLSLTDVSGLFLQLCFAIAFGVLALFLAGCFKFIFQLARRKNGDESSVGMEDDQTKLADTLHTHTEYSST